MAYKTYNELIKKVQKALADSKLSKVELQVFIQTLEQLYLDKK